MSTAVLRKNFERHLRQTLARDRYSATNRDRYYALALAVRDQLVDRWIATQQMHHNKNVKRVYYLSLEFLIGRMMGNNVINLKMEDICRAAMSQEGLDWEDLREYEIDAGLGNGGLGRLAACFMDSIATLDLPAVGYGLRYDFGIFKQNIKNGYQVEQPDEWLKHRYPWEIPHPEFSFEVQFEGQVETRSGPKGPEWHWVDTKTVIGIAYDLPVVGYGGRATVNTLRLWSAKSAEEFDLDDFNRGEYVEAVANKVLAENLTKVLYPDDSVSAGKELRLKQEYFFVSCTIQDILRRFKSDGNSWESFPDKVFVQLNDTHPALVIPGTDAACSWIARDWNGMKRGEFRPLRRAIPTTPSCPRRSRNGPSPCWSGCFRVTCRSSMKSIPDFLREVACRYPYDATGSAA